MINSISKKIEDLKSDFSTLDNPMDKYEYIIDLGKDKESISKNIRQEANLIKGCVSKAWVCFEYKDNDIT